MKSYRLLSISFIITGFFISSDILAAPSNNFLRGHNYKQAGECYELSDLQFSGGGYTGVFKNTCKQQKKVVIKYGLYKDGKRTHGSTPNFSIYGGKTETIVFKERTIKFYGIPHLESVTVTDYADSSTYDTGIGQINAVGEVVGSIDESKSYKINNVKKVKFNDIKSRITGTITNTSREKLNFKIFFRCYDAKHVRVTSPFVEISTEKKINPGEKVVFESSQYGAIPNNTEFCTVAMVW